MDGVLVIDKPEGLTSHDVVSAARRALGEKRIGHTGTLDPLATGVLPLACGRATRLVRFLTASDKDYEATIRFGLTTKSFDITGEETSASGDSLSREELTAFSGERASVSLTSSPGFYVRTFAHELGRLVGTGACLEALRRTR